MAKYTRFDPRNKKANKHKQRTKDGLNFKRIKYVETKDKLYYDDKKEV